MWHRWLLLVVLAVASTAHARSDEAEGLTQLRDAADESAETTETAMPEPPEPPDLDPASIVTAVLERMDVDLPRVLSPEELVILRDRCKGDSDAWASCVRKHGDEGLDCVQLDGKLARCLVESDDVVSLYLEIASEKKRIFGKDLYVEFAGLLAALPSEAIAEARTACPQPDVGAAAECLAQHPVVGEVIKVYYELAREVVEESAIEAKAAGNEIDVDAYADTVAQLFFQLPSGTIMTLAAACLKLHPELETVTSSEDIDRALECITEQGKTDPVVNPAYISKEKLLGWLEVARERVVAQIRSKELAKQDANFRRILTGVLLLLAGGYLLVLLSPLVLRRRYPRSTGLWKASVIAAGTFAITVGLLGASLLLIRGIQSTVAADSTSPRMRIADAAFAVLAKSDAAEAMSDLSKERLDFIKAPLKKIVEDVEGEGAEKYAVFATYLATHWVDLLDEPELKNIAKNVAMLESHASSMKSVFGLYSKVDWLMGIVPIILSLLAIVLFLLPLKSMVLDLVTAPARAAAGAGNAEQASARAMAAVKAEIKSIVPFLAVILVLLPVTGFFLALAMEPLVELLVGYSLLTLFYILFAEASAVVIYMSLGCAMVLLVVCLAAYITAMGAVLGQTRKIFRAIFHLGYRFADFKRFWIWSSVALLVMLALPFLYAYGALWLAGAAVDESGGFGPKDLLLVPVPALLLFPVIFWAARGWKAMRFIKRYPVPTRPASSSSVPPLGALADNG